MPCNIARRNELVALHGNRCGYCGRYVSLAKEKVYACHPNAASVEHIYPKWDLRRMLISEEDNTILACCRCNNKTNKEWTDKYIPERYKLPRIRDLLGLDSVRKRKKYFNALLEYDFANTLKLTK